LDNLIRLKELEVVSGASKKWGRGVRIFSFGKGFFWVKSGGWGTSTLFQSKFFLKERDR
jgi:hypothetical protein